MAPLEIRDMAQDFLPVKGRDMLSKALAFMLSRLPPVSNSHDQDDDRENDDWPHKYNKIGRHSRRFRCGCGSWDARRFEDGPPPKSTAGKPTTTQAMKQTTSLDVRLTIRHFLIKSWLYPQARFAPCLLAFWMIVAT